MGIPSAWRFLIAVLVALLIHHVQSREFPLTNETRVFRQYENIGDRHHHDHDSHHHHHHHGNNDVGTYSCGRGTFDRVSYFVNPTNLETRCSLVVYVEDPKVSQLRLDFESFSLEQPTRLKYNPSSDQYPAYTCETDSFTVSSSSVGPSKNFGVSNLCGENTGQHIYIPVNSASGPSIVQLIFNLADREINTPGLIQPSWKIKVTQIDCMESINEDICAPAGCLQYYSGPSGTFESFNFNNGAGHYTDLLNYAICFKRNSGICSMQFHPIRFQIAANDLQAPYGHRGCNMATVDPSMPNSRDYFFIPDAQAGETIYDSIFCGDSLQNNSVSTNSPGPLIVFFRSDAVSDDVDLGEEIGFKINYSESERGCYDVKG